jgi:hypothetical protein
MTTKIDRLTMIVAGFGSWTPYEGKVKEAETLLAEIERVCPEATTCPTCEKKLAKATDWEQVKIHNAVNAQREKDAKIAEAASNFVIGHGIAAAIRKGES